MMKVSVIVPLYQAKQYIQTCIESILSQTYKELELLLIDDGSKDGSLDICRMFQKEDSRIKVVHQENQGVSSARNRGLSIASGEYIVFVDSDDIIENTMIEYMVHKAQNYGCDIVLCGFDYVYHDKIVSRIPEVEEGIYNRKNVFMNFWEFYRKGIFHNIGTKLYSKSLLDDNCINFDNNRTVLEDVQFCLEAIKCTDKIFICNKCFYKYMMQVNQSSIQKTFRKNYYLILDSFFCFIADDLGIDKNKEFYLEYMDAILLTLKNELYKKDSKLKTVIQEYKNICGLDFVKESIDYIACADTRATKYLFYRCIWKEKVYILYVLVYLWNLGSEK